MGVIIVGFHHRALCIPLMLGADVEVGCFMMSIEYCKEGDRLIKYRLRGGGLGISHWKTLGPGAGGFP